ncbi:MAG: hypothetical protein ACOVN9_02400, partial [Inhella sp.]
MHLPAVHLCIVQPVGYVHSLGFVDQARFFRYQFRRMGAEVTLAKNRLRHDAVNFVFGAHLGFDPALRARHTCVFVNLEQLGSGGMSAPPAYLDLLGNSAVVDYDAANVSAYTAHAADVPLFSFAHAPYLRQPVVTPVEQRSIDLLFFGSTNERRLKLIREIESTGRRVTMVDGPLYGPERDGFIAQAKAVFNCHFYESARFEQARAFQCLSLGTPVISERGDAAYPPVQFEEGVFWVSATGLRDFFTNKFDQPGFAEAARAKLAAFARHDVIEQYADVLAFAAGYRSVQTKRMSDGPWRPKRLHIGSGKDYKMGWFNVDILESAQPDAVLDLARPLDWPLQVASDTVGPVVLSEGELEAIYANNVLEHVPDLPQLMTNCLALLQVGGEMTIEVPYEGAPSAWQDPTHVRAMNENSWIYYADWFWYLGWFKERFQVQQFQYLDSRLKECNKDSAHFMRVRLIKVATTLAERMTARTMQPSFGGLPDDLDCFDRGADTCTEQPDTPVPQAQAIAAGVTRHWMVVAPPHDDGVTSNFGHALASALRARGEAAIEVDMAGDVAAQLQIADLHHLLGVITVGSQPLGLHIGGVPLHRAVRCPVYMYLLDSPIYDLARVPATRTFIADAWNDERLVPVLAENSYLQLMRSGTRPVLPPQSRYMPFAAFTYDGEAMDKSLAQQRLLVVGSLGQELARGAVRDDLLSTLRDANAPGLTDNELHRLAQRLEAPDARGNVVADMWDALCLESAAMLEAPWQRLSTAADSYIKRARRVAAIESLRGEPVDFVGPGWQETFGSQKSFRFIGRVSHADIARLVPLYRGLVNFDPNWEWGMHDRAYTALASGVPVLTHAN